MRRSSEPHASHGFRADTGPPACSGTSRLQFAHRTAIAKLAMVPSSPDESDHLLHDARAAGLLVFLSGPAWGVPFSALLQ
jgi:hypothetical protein